MAVIASFGSKASNPKRANITQVELGQGVGQPQTFISRSEFGKRRLDIAAFVAVSRAVDADPHAIMRKADARNE